MNLASLITSFTTAASYSVTRTAANTTVRGRSVTGTQTTVTIIASVSPIDGLEAARVAAGGVDKQTRTLFTTTQLFAGGQGESYEADKVSIDGDFWQVDKVERWVDPRSRDAAYKVKVTRE